MTIGGVVNLTRLGQPSQIGVAIAVEVALHQLVQHARDVFPDGQVGGVPDGAVAG